MEQINRELILVFKLTLRRIKSDVYSLITEYAFNEILDYLF